jgi:hypothetical protein
MSGISLDEIVFATGAGATDSDTLRVQLSTESLAALENITVSATDLDIRDLSFATDSVDVSGSEVSLDAATLAALETITVTATDLDIRDLTHVSDSIKVGDGTDFLAVNADGSINVLGASAGSILTSAANVTTTAAQVLTSPLSNRVSVIIQNEGNQDVYVGSTSGVTSANGIKISKASSATLDISDAADIYMIAAGGSQSVRFLEIGA